MLRVKLLGGVVRLLLRGIDDMSLLSASVDWAALRFLRSRQEKKKHPRPIPATIAPTMGRTGNGRKVLHFFFISN